MKVCHDSVILLTHDSVSPELVIHVDYLKGTSSKLSPFYKCGSGVFFVRRRPIFFFFF